jgi:hypothetical protein
VYFCTRDREHILYIYRNLLFDKCLDDLRAKGGEALIAARKIDEFIGLLLKPYEKRDREKFRFTRNTEARIKNCKKVDLGCGYRLVCIKKNGHLALVYAGTHDECFRWIERNKGLTFDFSASAGIAVAPDVRSRKDLPADVLAEQSMIDEYEALLMSRINDEILRKIFFGLCHKPVSDEHTKQ